jgi:hypothetical protein
MFSTIIQLHRMNKILPSLLLIGLVLFSCASGQTAPEPETEVAVAEEAVPEPEPTPEQEPEAEIVEEPGDEYIVTKELYEQTFEEIEALIIELNSVISKKQFDRWLTYLSTVYIRTYNSKEVLNETNEYPQLKDNGIVLTDLRGYFDWVVVPSRSRAVLGEIVFAGETQVIAYSSFDGKRAKLYELERIDGIWKITVW